MDVMRLPSIADLYEAHGMTALVDATLKSQEDLATTSQIYGDHAFLTFVLTDGMENRSRHSYMELSQLLRNQGVNWTVGFLVPDAMSVAYVERMNVSRGNITTWDTASSMGVSDAVSTIRTATDNFMVGRSKGVRGTRSVFSTGADAVNDATVATLKTMSDKEYTLYPVAKKSRIDEFVKTMTGAYTRGKGFYQLTKTETIQPQKQIIVVERKTGKAYTGSDARRIIGLPQTGSVRVKPDSNPKYDIFVQSTSVNRNLMPNTKVLVLR
jgi:hypothetical protein